MYNVGHRSDQDFFNLHVHRVQVFPPSLDVKRIALLGSRYCELLLKNSGTTSKKGEASIRMNYIPIEVSHNVGVVSFCSGTEIVKPKLNER